MPAAEKRVFALAILPGIKKQLSHTRTHTRVFSSSLGAKPAPGPFTVHTVASNHPHGTSDFPGVPDVTVPSAAQRSTPVGTGHHGVGQPPPARRDPKWSQTGSQNDPKNGSKMAPERSQIHPNFVPTRFQSGPNIGPKQSQHGPNMAPTCSPKTRLSNVISGRPLGSSKRNHEQKNKNGK